METIIDIYNKLLVFNNSKINYEFDKDGTIWFKFMNIADILGYKSRKDALRDNVDKENKRKLTEIINIKKSYEQPDTIYINETGLYTLLIKSKMKVAVKFQLWLVKDALPNLRKYGKYKVSEKIKKKLDELNNKIKILENDNIKLKKNMTKRKYPTGNHIYVIEDEGLYKIGNTKDLNKRLQTYNTGKANKAEYKYYKKTNCAKEIETCMKAILNKYIYKSKKEFYNCSLNKIIKSIKKCLDIEEECIKCKDIKIQLGGSISNNIIDKLIIEYIDEYNNIIFNNNKLI